MKLGRLTTFSTRFELHRWDTVFVVVIALLIWGRVYERGHQNSEGLLGRPLRVGIVAWPGYAAGLVANNGLKANKDSVFWKKSHLLVEFVPVEDETDLRNQLAAGGANRGLDVIWSTVDSLALQYPKLQKAGINARAFLQVDWSRGGDAIVAASGIERIEDLKGKQVAVSMAASLWLLEYSLENSSVTPEDRTQIRHARVKTNGSPEALELFVTKKVAAAVLWEPDVSQALVKRPGASILVDTGKASHLIADVMVADEKFIRRNPEVIAAFIEGWLLDGTPSAIGDPMEAVKALQKERGFDHLDSDAVHRLLGKVALATLEDNAEMFGLSGGDAFFDQLFNRASLLWSDKGYMVPPSVKAKDARDITSLSEIYRVHGMQRTARVGCGTVIMTREIIVPFPAGSADLKPEALGALDDLDLAMLLKTYSDARFCVQATANDQPDPRQALQLSRARAKGVIQYLMTRYNRPSSQFVAATTDTSETAASENAARYICLRVITPHANVSEQGAQSLQSAGAANAGGHHAR